MTDEIINVKPMMIRELFNLLLEAEKALGARIYVDIKNEENDLKTMIGTLGRKPIVACGFLLSELTLMNANNLDGIFRKHFNEAIGELKNEMEKECK